MERNIGEKTCTTTKKKFNLTCYDNEFFLLSVKRTKEKNHMIYFTFASAWTSTGNKKRAEIPLNYSRRGIKKTYNKIEFQQYIVIYESALRISIYLKNGIF